MDHKEALRGKRVLIVDDHQLNIYALQSALNAVLDIEVLSADSGAEAVKLLSADEHGIDMVLMDMMMPAMSGYEATEILRAQEQDANQALTIIAVTARAMKEDREKCLAAGVTDYVSKPVDVFELVEVMARHCEH